MAVYGDDIFPVPRPGSFLSPPVENAANSLFFLFWGKLSKGSLLWDGNQGIV